MALAVGRVAAISSHSTIAESGHPDGCCIFKPAGRPIPANLAIPSFACRLVPVGNTSVTGRSSKMLVEDHLLGPASPIWDADTVANC